MTLKLPLYALFSNAHLVVDVVVSQGLRMLNQFPYEFLTSDPGSDGGNGVLKFPHRRRKRRESPNLLQKSSKSRWAMQPYGRGHFLKFHFACQFRRSELLWLNLILKAAD